ncbi:MAG: hypothetical protein GY679_01670 [Mycoplasma sp.]|nr:hypothetical protein [Mycoplasma sp.]
MIRLTQRQFNNIMDRCEKKAGEKVFAAHLSNNELRIITVKREKIESIYIRNGFNEIKYWKDVRDDKVKTFQIEAENKYGTHFYTPIFYCGTDCFEYDPQLMPMSAREFYDNVAKGLIKILRVHEPYDGYLKESK